MKAHQGDRIILAASHVDEPTRDGEVLEVRGKDGEPPYLVRWADGHTGLMYPGAGSILRVEAEHVTGAPAESPQALVDRPTGDVVEPTLRHVRDWQVRVSIFESGDDTSATVVLLSDAPVHLTGRGESHRKNQYASIPEIGSEVAVARALRNLADQLLATAAQDIVAVNGEDTFIQPS